MSEERTIERSTGQPHYLPGFMDLQRYRLKRGAFDSAWDAFVSASPQGTLFSESVFLGALKGRAAVWWCLRGEERAAAIVTMESADGRSAISYPNVIHNGILFSADTQKQNESQILSEQFRITSFIAATLPDVYDEITLTLHYTFRDLRPFLWHNYGEGGDKYRVDIRYTSILSLRGHDRLLGIEESPIYRTANKSRRQELRYALKKGFTTEERTDIALFIDLYRQTFERQGIGEETIDFDELTHILSALDEAGRLRMFIGRAPDGVAATVALFAADAKRWYYLFGAGDPAQREGHSGTLVMWDAFGVLAERGAVEVDLEGVNSPRRGYFKLSFGGALVPYYRVSLVRAESPR